MGYLDALKKLKEEYGIGTTKNIEVEHGLHQLICKVCAESNDPKLKRIIISFGTNPNIKDVTCEECGTTYVKN